MPVAAVRRKSCTVQWGRGFPRGVFVDPLIQPFLAP